MRPYRQEIRVRSGRDDPSVQDDNTDTPNEVSSRPEWRDLLFQSSTNRSQLKPLPSPLSSRAQPRDLRCASRASQILELKCRVLTRPEGYGLWPVRQLRTRHGASALREMLFPFKPPNPPQPRPVCPAGTDKFPRPAPACRSRLPVYRRESAEYAEIAGRNRYHADRIASRY